MENFILACSNLMVCAPLAKSASQKDYLTFVILLFMGSASFISHLIENHANNMPGIGFSREISLYANRLDIVACAVTGLQLVYLFWNRVKKLTITIAQSLSPSQ